MTTGRDNHNLDEATALGQELARLHRDFVAWRSRLLEVDGRDGHTRDPGDADAICAHAVFTEDATLHAVLEGAAPLFAKPKHRAAVLQRQVRSSGFANYMRNVFGAAEAYIERLGPDSLAQPVDLSSIGLGRPSVSWVINNFIILELTRACNHALELPDASA
jgi:hypothetical protein